MLHFMPVDPLGHVESIPTVHSCEHTEWPSMSNVFVQTWLAHSVDMSLGFAHVSPNWRLPVGLGSSVQAPSNNEHARRNRRMPLTLQ